MQEVTNELGYYVVGSRSDDPPTFIPPIVMAVTAARLAATDLSFPSLLDVNAVNLAAGRSY